MEDFKPYTRKEFVKQFTKKKYTQISPNEISFKFDPKSPPDYIRFTLTKIKKDVECQTEPEQNLWSMVESMNDMKNEYNKLISKYEVLKLENEGLFNDIGNIYYEIQDILRKKKKKYAIEYVNETIRMNGW